MPIQKAQFIWLNGEFVPGTKQKLARVGSGKIGQVTKTIRDEFFAVVRGRRRRHKDWLTYIYASSG